MRALALVIIASLCAFAQEVIPEIPPRIIKKVEPQYSEEARKAHLEGHVTLFLVVDADGKPRDLKNIGPLGLGLDENAIAAVGKWKFAPGTKHGEPVDTKVQIAVNFRPLNRDPKVDQWHLKRVDFDFPEGALRPVVEKVAAPMIADGAVSATATLIFHIDEKGKPTNLQINRTTDGEWARDVTDALGKWGFKPATKDGRPVPARCTMDFVRGN